MKALLQEFWVNPVKKLWFIIANITLFGGFYLAYYFLDKHINPLLSLALILIALIFELTAIAFLAPTQLKEMRQDILSIIRWANRDALYYHYQIKNEHKNYKGPNWNDAELSKIQHHEDRVESFVQASIDFQKADFEKWKKRSIGKNLDHRSETSYRILLVLIFAGISFLILYKTGWLTYIEADFIAKSQIDNKSFYTIPAALISTLIASPIIFVVWYFRDKNNRIQIENARKDTNLKDFQKLSEWASGFHLPEIKYTNTVKTSSKKNQNLKIIEKTNETMTNKEDFIAPEDSNNISRRHGAEALQASAIAQLEAFMFGKYGEQFMQPAFLLIHAIWESIATQLKDRYKNDIYEETRLNFIQNPIMLALNRALCGASGKYLRLFEQNLKGMSLIGLNSSLGALKPLSLADCNLSGINFSFSTLTNIQLQNANLTNANFTKSDLGNACFIKAYMPLCTLKEAELTDVYFVQAVLANSNFKKANFSGANLDQSILSNADLSDTFIQRTSIRYSNAACSNFSLANLIECTLIGSHFQNSNFKGCVLKNCDLSDTDLYQTNFEKSQLNDTNFTNAILIESNLKDCNLQGSNFTNTNFQNSIINISTLFGYPEKIMRDFKLTQNIDNKIREEILSRGAIWDDDPEWLVGKIQDAALLEKIRQDCSDRAKQKGA